MRNNSRGLLSAGQIKRTGSQKGIVLFITLIVLTAMMLVTAAMIRSTDTSLLAVGNLSLRQASQAQVNHAVERVIRDISAVIDGENFTDYSYILPNLQPQNDKGIPNILQNGNTPPVGQSLVITTADGFTIYGVVERMCSSDFEEDMNTAPDPALCMVTGSAGGSSPIAQRNDGEVGVIGAGTINGPIFRVTVRVDGPKSTTVYAQAFLS